MYFRGRRRRVGIAKKPMTFASGVHDIEQVLELIPVPLLLFSRSRALLAANAAGLALLRAEHLDLGVIRENDDNPLGPLGDVEREHISRVLRATGGQKSRAAEILGVSRPRLNRLLHRYGLE